MSILSVLSAEVFSKFSSFSSLISMSSSIFAKLNCFTRSSRSGTICASSFAETDRFEEARAFCWITLSSVLIAPLICSAPVACSLEDALMF